VNTVLCSFNTIQPSSLIMHSPSDSVGECIMFLGCPVRPSVLSSGQTLLPRYLMNGINIFVKANGKYLLAPTDDLV